MTVSNRGPRGPYAKSTEQREKIIAAAVEVFSVSGFRKGSIREVADLAGLTQAGLLHHYPTKQALLEAVLQWRDDETMKHWGGSFPEGLDALRTTLELVTLNAKTPRLIELQVTISAEATSPEHPVHEYFVHRYQSVTDALESAFTEIQREGHLRPGIEPASAARGLVAMLDGLQVQWLLNPKRVDMVEELRRYLHLLVDAEL